MFCTKCGHKNTEEAAFCINCGSPLQGEGKKGSIVSPQAQYSASPQRAYTGYPPQMPKSNRKGLVLGLVIGGVVLIAAAVVLIILLTGGTSVEGLWCSEKRAEVLEFEDDGDINIYSIDGDFEGEYKYDKHKGEGVITVDDVEFDFEVDKDEMDVDNTEVYTKVTEKDFDIIEFIEDTAVELPSLEMEPIPTAMPTPQPTPVYVPETVADTQMTLQFAFGERTGTYTGEVLDGLPNGQGAFTSANDYGVGWTYEGEWANGHFSGQGTSTHDDGFTIIGYYQNDYLNGESKQYWQGALRYEGSYTDAVQNGQGTLYNHHTEVIFSGLFVNGFFSETAEQRIARVGAFKDQSVVFPYQELYGYAQDEISVRAQVTGTVLQVYEYEENEQYYCDFLMYEQGVEEVDRVIQVYYRLSEGEPKVQEGQTVTVWGTTEYLYSYTSVEEEYLTVPQIEAWSVE